MMPVTVPEISPRTMPSIAMRPRDSCRRSGVGTENEVFSMTRPPSSRICGRQNMTRMIEMIVPRPRLCPMPTIVPSELIRPRIKPAEARIEPEVRMVGNAKFIVSMIASRGPISCWRSV